MGILVAEDHRILLESLALLLSGIDGIEVALEHTNGRQVLTPLEPEPDIAFSSGKFS